MPSVLVVALLAVAQPCGAQADGTTVRYADLVRDRVTVYRGDATVGPVSASGWRVAVGVRSAQGYGGELWMATSDSASSAPRLDLLGAAGSASFGRWLLPGMRGVFEFGVVVMRVSEWPDFSGCIPENGCFLEGGPSFENGWGFTPTVGVGLLWSHAWFRARVDYRVVPSNDVSGQTTTRRGIGVGVVW